MQSPLECLREPVAIPVFRFIPMCTPLTLGGDTRVLRITITIMKTVSIQEMRFEFAGVRAALEAGEELVLTFRNRPLARLLPFASPAPPTGLDSALQFAEEPENLDPMTNAKMDELIYG
jgi:antitoxin (DNA-binding transcriptional repressor) of toxin-antitoxin stability system